MMKVVVQETGDEVVVFSPDMPFFVFAIIFPNNPIITQICLDSRDSSHYECYFQLTLCPYMATAAALKWRLLLERAPGNWSNQESNFDF